MALKTMQVVAALIINHDKVFATQRGYGELKMAGISRSEIY